jgi:2-polyprenyl-3-methyl-5-hydroxy-6-metoxy-1,4-benzoquinol methylase
MPEITDTCWVCGNNRGLVRVKPSNISKAVTSKSFAITDSAYGVTGELAKCPVCGFLQCTNLTDVLGFYQDLEDPGYESSRKQRSLQARKILATLAPFANGKKLLDIGAGSGILVEEARQMGFDAAGIEPSRWLQDKARRRGLEVVLGIFPHPDLPGPFDVITLTDVIEHVSDPVGLLKAAGKALAPGGIIAVTTPDVGALLPKILRYRWWHFRVAHIGYFNKKTLSLAAKRAGLEKIYSGRAKWYFAADYLLERVKIYLPKFLRFPTPKFLERLTIPLNLGDSMFMIFKKK